MTAVCSVSPYQMIATRPCHVQHETTNGGQHPRNRITTPHVCPANGRHRAIINANPTSVNRDAPKLQISVVAIVAICADPGGATIRSRD